MITPKLLSIIIPVYNAENFLRECLDSIIVSTFTDYEIICINDGSSDLSADILKEYQNRYDNIIVIHQQNKGVSATRNVGIENATGEWITFIDSDDIITKTFLEGITEVIAYHDHLDFVHAGFLNYWDGKKQSIGQGYEYYVGNDMKHLYPRFRGLIFSKLFRKSIIKDNGIKFDESINSAEDMLFTLKYINHINHYAFVTEKGYLYRRDNVNSLTHTFSQKSYKISLHSFLEEYDSVSYFVSKHHLDVASCLIRYQRLCEELLFTIFRLYDGKYVSKERIQRIKNDIPSQVFFLKKYCTGKFNKIILKLLDLRLYHLTDWTIYFFIVGYGRNFRK